MELKVLGIDLDSIALCTGEVTVQYTELDCINGVS